MRGLKMKSAAITEADPLKLHKKLLKNSTLTIIRSFGICSKLERWKCLISGCLMSWLQIKKMIVLKCRHLLFYTMNHFSIGLWYVIKWVLYNWRHQLSGWTEQHLPSASQGHTCTKKGHGHCLMVCCLPDPLQLSGSQWNHYLWEVSSAHWWDAPKTAANIGQQNGLNSPWKCQTAHLTTNVSKVERIGLWSFASSAIFTWPLANRLPLLQASQQLFAGKMLLQLGGGRKY